MKLINQILAIAILSLYSCSTEYSIKYYQQDLIESKALEDSMIIAIIEPYQNAIETAMDEVLCYTETELNKDGMTSTLGNFVTDLCLNYAEADICVMNNGGLRTIINKGPITRGKIYELMPFENELVVLELNKEDYINLINYIIQRQGEPFSGIKIKIDSNNKLISNTWPVNFEKKEKIKVLTSDYLAEGGDNMSFFQNKKQEKIGMKVRDAIIDYCKKYDTLNINIDSRIQVIEHEE